MRSLGLTTPRPTNDSSSSAPQSDLDFLNSTLTAPSVTTAPPSAAPTTNGADEDITKTLQFISLSKELDASIPDSLASTQAAYDALLSSSSADTTNTGENQDDAEGEEGDEVPELDDQAIVDLLRKMESADMAAQEFEGRLDKLLQGLDGMLESLGAVAGKHAGEEDEARIEEQDESKTQSEDQKPDVSERRSGLNGVASAKP